MELNMVSNCLRFGFVLHKVKLTGLLSHFVQVLLRHSHV